MPEKKRGLPPSFELDVPESISSGPTQLGDYLEEEDRPRPSRSREAKPTGSGSRREAPVRSLPSPAPRQPVPRPVRTHVSVPRKQINMSPETIRMVDELMDYFRTYSVQKDLKASELFHALVLALYEAREHIDLTAVRPRGRWGSPLAAAFPVALKNAFQRAIVSWFSAIERG